MEPTTPPGETTVHTDPPPQNPTPETGDHFVPRGAFYFALVLITGYAIYFFLTWYEIVILRGGA